MKITTVIVLATLVADVALVARIGRYDSETMRLRSDMTARQRERADLAVASEQHRLQVAIELLRRQARADAQLHLAIHVDSGYALLERDGVVLRQMTVAIAPQRFATGAGDSVVSVAALGQRTVSRLLGPRDSWDVPADVFRARGLPVPDDRRVAGAFGERAIVLSDRTVLYAAPDSGLLSDTTVVLPGSIRLAPADLRAIAASVRPGMSAYLYR